MFHRAEEVYNEVVGLSPADRAERLAALCGHEPALRSAVNALLDAASRVGGFLEEPVLGRAFDQINRESQAEERDDLVGSVLGHFRLERRLASGGMGTVYLAARSDDQFKQIVAIKIVKRGMDSEEILRRFSEERQALAQFNHPNIARLLDAGVTADGRPYLVMEYIDGLSIDRYCDRNRLSINQRLRLFRQVCEGVHAAHQSLIIHRDLKPSNILVTPQGTPKLLDFGIAKVLSGAASAGNATVLITAASERRLTPEYASPEQVEGGAITTASDVYSLGIVLYELLTGRRPYAFTLRTTQEVRRVVCGSTPPPPSEAVTRKAGAHRVITSAHQPLTQADSDERTDHPQTHRVSSTRLRGQLRGDLDTIVMMALRKEPQRRYASAEQFAADIGRYLAGMPVSARRDTWLYRTRKFVRRNAPAVIAAGVAVVILIASLVLRTQQRNQIAAQRDELAAANASLRETRRMLVEMLSGAQAGARGPAATLGEVLQDAARSLESEPPRDEVTLVGIQEALGSAMMSLGMTERARPLLESAFERLKSLPENSEPRLAVEAELAQLLYYEGKHAQAEAPLRDLLTRERARNSGAPTTLEGDLLNTLGAVLRVTNRLEDAMTTQREALTVRTAVHGPQSLPVAESHNNIASIHLSAGRYDQAIAGYKSALSIRERTLRAGHPLLLATEANLGQALYRSGDTKAAITMLSRAADRWAEVYGDAHPGRVVALTSLGLALQAEKRSLESAAAFQQALDWQLVHQDPAGPAVLATRANIAIARSTVLDCDQSIRSFAEIESHPRVRQTVTRGHPAHPYCLRRDAREV